MNNTLMVEFCLFVAHPVQDLLRNCTFSRLPLLTEWYCWHSWGDPGTQNRSRCASIVSLLHSSTSYTVELSKPTVVAAVSRQLTTIVFNRQVK